MVQNWDGSQVTVWIDQNFSTQGTYLAMLDDTFVVISGNSLSGPNFKDFLLLFS